MTHFILAGSSTKRQACAVQKKTRQLNERFRKRAGTIVASVAESKGVLILGSVPSAPSDTSVRRL